MKDFQLIRCFQQRVNYGHFEVQIEGQKLSCIINLSW